MSYSQEYSAAVTVSGSKVVNYPKSENGGSIVVHYSDTEDVKIRIDVDTMPFDANVGICRASLDELSGSVIVMNQAQCSEIENSAECISGNIVDGFFNLIKSELSQQSVDLKNRFESQLMLLGQLAKQLAVYKKNMDDDYNRISSRYHNLFDELNKECYRRIYALNKPCFDIADDLARKIIIEPLMKAAGETSAYSGDLQHAENSMIASRLRSRACLAVASLGDYIIQEGILKRTCQGMISDREIEARSDLVFPCLWIEADGIEEEGRVLSPVLPADLPEHVASTVNGSLVEACTNNSAIGDSLKTDDALQLKIQMERLLEMNEGGADEARVRALIKKLWENDQPGVDSTQRK